jgi:hypothetical protein
MFVAAESFTSSACSGVFTHVKREENAGMRSGKFDEEHRMSAVVDAIRPNTLLLCNESLASTNEREGSEIAGRSSGRCSTQASGCCSSPTCTTSRTAATSSALSEPCSCGPSGSLAGSAPSNSSRANHSPPAQAKTCPGGSSPRPKRLNRPAGDSSLTWSLPPGPQRSGPAATGSRTTARRLGCDCFAGTTNRRGKRSSRRRDPNH